MTETTEKQGGETTANTTTETTAPAARAARGRAAAAAAPAAPKAKPAATDLVVCPGLQYIRGHGDTEEVISPGGVFAATADEQDALGDECRPATEAEIALYERLNANAAADAESAIG